MESPRPSAYDLRIEGTIVDASSRPVAGVVVRASSALPAVWWDPDVSTTDREGIRRRAWGDSREGARPPRGAGTPIVETRTSDAGTFVLLVGSPGAWEVRAVPSVEAGLVSTVAVVHLEPRDTADPDPEPGTAHLLLAPGASLRGRIVDAEGKGVGGVLRAWWRSERPGRGSWWSPRVASHPDDGGFEVPPLPTAPLPGFLDGRPHAGTLDLQFALPGRLLARRHRVVPGSRATAVFTLPATGVVEGRVEDVEGHPIPRAVVVVEVTHTDSGGSLWTFRKRTRADATARFRVRGMPAGQLAAICAWAPGFLVSTAATDEETTPERVQAGRTLETRVVLERGNVVEGTVREAGTGRPLRGVRVHVSEQSTDPPFFGLSFPLRTDARGHYRSGLLAPGRYGVCACSPTHYLAELDEVPRDSEGSEVPASLMTTLEGRGARGRVDLTMRPARRLEGTVHGPAGAPLANTWIRLSFRIPRRSWWGHFLVHANRRGPFDARSDERGAFTILGLPPRADWLLTVDRAPYLSEPLGVDTTGTGRTVRVSLALRMGASVTGTVEDEMGRPVCDVSLRAKTEGPSGPHHPRRATSDANGRFRVEGLPVGRVTLCAAKRGRVASEVQLEVPEAGLEGIVLRVEAGCVVSGRVTDGLGTAVVGAQVGLHPPGPIPRLVEASSSPHPTHADPSGSFRFEGAPRGPFFLTVRTAHGRPERFGPFHAPVDGLHLVVRSRQPRDVQVRVLDHAGRPVPLACVRVAPAGGQSSDLDLRPCQTPSPDGVFTSRVSGSPPYDLEVSAPRDLTQQPLNLRPTVVRATGFSTPPFVVRLRPGRQAWGRVVGPDGDGVAAVGVRVGMVRTQTAADGRFRVGGLGEHQAWLFFTPPDDFVRPDPVGFLAAEGLPLVTLHPAASISGRLLDETGRPAHTGWVEALWRTQGASGSATAQVGETGAFRVGGIPPGAVVDLRGSQHRGHGSTSCVRAILPGVVAGASDVDLQIERGVEIEGTVVGPDGAALIEGAVEAVPEPGGDTRVAPFASVSRGRFMIRGAVAGAWYGLWVYGEDGRRGPVAVRVQAPSRDVRLVASAATREDQGGEDPTNAALAEAFDPPRGLHEIAGTLDAGDGGVFGARGWVEVVGRLGSRSGSVAPDGRFLVQGLTPGEYRVEGGIRDTALTASAEGVPAGTNDLRMLLREGGRVVT